MGENSTNDDVFVTGLMATEGPAANETFADLTASDNYSTQLAAAESGSSADLAVSISLGITLGVMTLTTIIGE